MQKYGEADCFVCSTWWWYGYKSMCVCVCVCVARLIASYVVYTFERPKQFVRNVLCIYIHTYIHTHTHTYTQVFQILTAYPYALKQHLRGQRNLSEMYRILPAKDVDMLAEVCMYVCIYVYMYVCIYMRRLNVSHITYQRCTYTCWGMYVCMYVCIYVCVYVCIYMRRLNVSHITYRRCTIGRYIFGR